RAIFTGAAQQNTDQARSTYIRRRLEQHVDGRPGKVYRRVDRQREGAPRLHQQMIARWRDIDRARRHRFLVFRLLDLQLRVGAEQFGETTGLRRQMNDYRDWTR